MTNRNLNRAYVKKSFFQILKVMDEDDYCSINIKNDERIFGVTYLVSDQKSSITLPLNFI